MDVQEQIAKLRAYVAMLTEILILRGSLTEGHRAHLERLVKTAGTGPPRVEMQSGDKYCVPNQDIDCASLVHLCKARCCSFSVTLPLQDLEEGGLPWDWETPYILSRGDDGYCVKLDRGGTGCTNYDTRPGSCRSYNCREDRRVWLDFENREPAPVSERIIPLESLQRKLDTSA